MNEVQINKPLKLNLDKDPKELSPEEAFYLLNHERYLNEDGSKKGTLGKTTPMVANYLACDLQQPVGENYSVGSMYSKQANELYWWVYNSNGVHFIMRLLGNGDCQVVYHGCLSLNADPKHEITQFRSYLKRDKLCANQHGKQLIWTNGDAAIGQLDVEASIATDFFTTPFFQRCPDPCAYVQMCVPEICGCVHGEFIPPAAGDDGKNNSLVDVAIKIAIRHVYYDGRASEWSDPSKPFYQSLQGCFETTTGLSRCLKLRVPVGNPLVDKIEIAFWKEGIWYLSDTVEKYKKYNDTQQYWYERDLAELLNYSDTDCSFDYIFCNDKQCTPLDPTEFTRVYNPMPQKPQGILPLSLPNQESELLGFYNYEAGECPLDRKEVEKMDITLNCASEDCDQEYATIKIRAVIHNRSHDRNQFIYTLGDGGLHEEDDPSKVAWFGGLVPDGGLETGWDQNFNDRTRNFIAYIEGTDYFVELKQFQSNVGFTTKKEIGVLTGLGESSNQTSLKHFASSGQFFYQEGELRVPKGTRGFLRLCSQHATGLEPDTSTYVSGIIQNIAGYRGDIGTMNLDAITEFKLEEIYFDTCSGDVDDNKAFLIDDNIADAGLTTKSSAYQGYIKDANGLPVEGAKVESGASYGWTDHNGFYNIVKFPGTDGAINIDIKVEQDCYNFTTIKTFTVSGSPGFMETTDVEIDDEDWPNTFFATVKMKVEDCNGIGVPGVRVALSGSKSRISGADGFAIFKIRNYEERNRVVRGVIMSSNNCFNRDCANECNACAPTSTSSTPACYFSEPVITLGAGRINTSSISGTENGLMPGGRYPFGIVVEGDCGHISAAYEVKYIDIPKVQVSKNEEFCTFGYNGNGITFPDWAKCMKIVRGINVNPFLIEWLVDDIERTSDGNIKLTIQSLNDYNAKYLFKTNTTYQWLKGDRVEFIKNGDGEIFTIAENGLLNYLTISPFNDEEISGETDPPADFFNQLLIIDDGRLDSLVKGAKIQIFRPKDCTTEPTYFSICVSIPIVDGRLAYDSGVFHTFDTYKVSRKIGEFPSQQFFHQSPSDFWGTFIAGSDVLKVDDTGRAHFVNKYENTKRFGRNITINAASQYNFFGDLVKKINPFSHGDIIAMYVKDGKIGMCISEHDNSLFEVSDDFLRVGSDGVVRAATPDAIISDTQPKLYGEFGCAYSAVGSIYFGDGWAVWQDVKKHARVKHDYSIAKAVDVGKVQSYSKKRCQEIETWNQNNSNPLDKYRFSVGYNMVTGVVYQTLKKLRDNGYNNEKAPYLKSNDTIGFDPITEDFTTFASFTPEGYGSLELFDGFGCAMVAFLQGSPYIFPIIPEKFNEFFGVPCDRVIGISLNQSPRQIKKGLSIELQDETMWFVHNVSIENTNFRSEIPAIRWKKDQNKWNAAFLANINSRGGLYGEDNARGYYHAITFVRDNTVDLRYNTVNNAKRVKFDSLDLILMKYMVSEQSGFTQNL